jgi:hypothetical protein
MGIATLKALGIMLVVGAVAHASMPYLPLIGPPALRLQTVKTPPADWLTFQSRKVPASPATATNSSAASAVMAAATAAATNALAQPPMAPAPATPALAQSPELALGDNFTAPILSLPTPDLLGLTPQMLATYFRPMQVGTNSALLAAPFRVSFMPPLPPDKSSHAEYIVK